MGRRLEKQGSSIFHHGLELYCLARKGKKKCWWMGSPSLQDHLEKKMWEESAGADGRELRTFQTALAFSRGTRRVSLGLQVRPNVRKMEANSFREISSYSWLWQAGERNI